MPASHVLRTVLFTTGDVCYVNSMRPVLSTTATRFIVSTTMISLIAKKKTHWPADVVCAFTQSVGMALLKGRKSVIPLRDVTAQHANAVPDGRTTVWGIALRCVEMEWLLAERNVTAHLNATTSHALAPQSILLTGTVGYAVTVGITSLKSMSSVMGVSTVTSHANANKATKSLESTLDSVFQLRQAVQLTHTWE